MDKPRLVFQRPDLSYEGLFKSPSVRLFNFNTGILDAFLTAMTPFGATLQGLRADLRSEDLSNAYVAASIYGGFGRAGFGASSLWVQLTQFPAPPKPDVASKVIAALLTTITDAIGEVELVTHRFILVLHGSITGTTPSELIARYVTPPPEAFGPLVSSGVAYRLGTQDKRKSLSLRFEPSASIQPGLFVNAQLDLDASEITAPDAPIAALAHIRAILQAESFPLEVEWTQAPFP